MAGYIQIKDVYKSYWRNRIEIPILRNINLEIDEKDFIALMGPSGSGKTTLLNLISGIDRPTSGKISIQGEDISHFSESAMANWRSTTIGFIFQFYNLIPVLTAQENVELPLLLTGLSKARRKKQSQTALAVVGLAERMNYYPKQLSGGQEQKVAIARAIATDPAIIVADEPTGDLDKQSADEILTLLERLNREFAKTILMVTHDPHASARAKTIRHLEKGDLIEESL